MSVACVVDVVAGDQLNKFTLLGRSLGQAVVLRVWFVCCCVKRLSHSLPEEIVLAPSQVLTLIYAERVDIVLSPVLIPTHLRKVFQSVSVETLFFWALVVDRFQTECGVAGRGLPTFKLQLVQNPG